MEDTKYYTGTFISDEYEKLSDKEKVIVLSEALSHMQQYNGRSKLTCIAFAMGYKNDEGEFNTFTKTF